MIKKEFKETFLGAIKAKLPSDILLVSYISKMINVGREASYRRIRGDVEFTFSEVMAIVEDLNIPLSQLTDNRFEYIPFVPYLVKDNPAEEYNSNLKQATDDFRNMIDSGVAKVSFCYDSVPPELMFRYSSVMSMRWTKYVAQHEMGGVINIDNVELPSCIQDSFNKFEEALLEFDIVLVISERLLQPTFEEIKYFASLNFFSKEFLYKLEKDISQFLNKLESYSLAGKSERGRRFDMYLYHVYSTGSIVLAEGAEKSIAYMKTFGTNYFSTEDAEICEAQKNWIQNMKKNSTYITQSGEITRSNFFRDQRALLAKCIEDSAAFLD